MALPDLIVLSHLRWGFVYQRPQHLLSRLAGRWRVWFVEEPVHSDDGAWLEYQEVNEHLTVVVPHTPVKAFGFHDDQLSALGPLLVDMVAAKSVQDPTVWLYTPMALPLVKSLQPACVVYDCMDELSAFKDAPRQLRQRELALMKRAAVVFTGGPSLYQAKQGQHPNLHCVPSSVDAAHFAPSNVHQDSPEHATTQALQGALPRPRFGFYGVIDERLDLRLVQALAEARPDYQIVMAGPVVKIDAATLPQRDNLHWLGMQPYTRLPYLLAGWDVCLMPFALNEATRFISPTKTLEYMAGEKPIVSTPVNDVVQLYGHAVRIAADEDAFIRACDEAWEDLRIHGVCSMAADMLMTVSSQSWDQSANAVHRLLDEARRDALLETQPAPLFEEDDMPLVAAGGRAPA